MLRGPRDVGNGLDCHAIVVSLKGRTQNRQLLMRLQSSEALVGLDHAGRDPSQGHAGIPPSSTRSSPRCSPSIWPTRRSSADRSAAMKSASRAADSATNLREAADFETPDHVTVYWVFMTFLQISL